MTISMGGVTIDCIEPRKLAEFWTKALDATVEQDYEGEFVLLRPAGTGVPYVGLQRVDEERAGKNRVHIDFGCEDRATEVARLVTLGAREIAQHSIPGLSWTVLLDPEGNEFCVGTIGG